MSGTWALLPVKAAARSKTRLLSVLKPQDCALLSHAMFMDVLTALEQTSGIDHIAVLTNDDQAAELSLQLGHEVIRDDDGNELCDGLNAAAELIAQRGGQTVVVIPGDIPTITATDIDELLQKHQTGLSLCPAIRDGGTNAIVCSPPHAISFQFGQDSARRHLEAAENSGITHLRLAMPAFFRDIDMPEDLLWLSTRETESNTLTFLRQSGIFARLGPDMSGASA
jgi:2-phospho-L-lactate guanylyltransferase